MTPRVHVSADDLRLVIELAEPRWSDARWADDPLVFSASDRGIWPRTTRDPASRIYVDGESWLLDELRRIAISQRYHPRYGCGGMIRVTASGAFWVRDERPLAAFDPISCNGSTRDVISSARA